MKQKTNINFILALGISIALIACNQQSKTDKTKTDTTSAGKTETTTMPAYDPAMDPTTVEAAFIKVLADTLNVKLYELVAKPGDSVGLHTHPDHILYVVDGGTLEIKLKDGTLNVLEVKPGMGFMLGPETHSAKIGGATTVKLVVADIYRPRS
jgi:quercetin dioxygenase-like cupin family protein